MANTYEFDPQHQELTMRRTGEKQPASIMKAISNITPVERT